MVWSSRHGVLSLHVRSGGARPAALVHAEYRIEGATARLHPHEPVPLIEALAPRAILLVDAALGSVPVPTAPDARLALMGSAPVAVPPCGPRQDEIRIALRGIAGSRVVRLAAGEAGRVDPAEARAGAAWRLERDLRREGPSDAPLAAALRRARLDAREGATNDG
ncbi:MAG: hypothetical protein ACU0CO_00050 [Shimia sp.]